MCLGTCGCVVVSVRRSSDTQSKSKSTILGCGFDRRVWSERYGVGIFHVAYPEGHEGEGRGEGMST